MRFQHSPQYSAHFCILENTDFLFGSNPQKEINEVRIGLHRGQSVCSRYLRGFLLIYEKGANTFCRYTLQQIINKPTRPYAKNAALSFHIEVQLSLTNQLHDAKFLRS
jgi:hypothetical protein